MALHTNTQLLQQLIDFSKSLPAAIILPTLANEASAENLLEGRELIDGSGNKIIGTMPNVNLSKPTLEIDEKGKISSEARVLTGFIYDSFESNTLQLDTQETMTITPNDDEQLAINEFTYALGSVTVAPIPYRETIGNNDGTFVEIG